MTEPDQKRKRTDDDNAIGSEPTAADVRSRRSALLDSLNRRVSPPYSRVKRSSPPHLSSEVELEIKEMQKPAKRRDLPSKASEPSQSRILPSPFKLTRIRNLPANANVDSISIRDILGHVLLKEVWLFDYLFDVDWVT